MSDEKPLKQFLLFGGDNYSDAQGGWRDFIDSFRTVEKAFEEAERVNRLGWYQVVDSKTGQIWL